VPSARDNMDGLLGPRRPHLHANSSLLLSADKTPNQVATISPPLSQLIRLGAGQKAAAASSLLALRAPKLNHLNAETPCALWAKRHFSPSGLFLQIALSGLRTRCKTPGSAGMPPMWFLLCCKLFVISTCLLRSFFSGSMRFLTMAFIIKFCPGGGRKSGLIEKRHCSSQKFSNFNKIARD